MRIFAHLRFYAANQFGELRLGPQHVDLSQQLVGVENLRHMRTYHLCHLRQDVYHLAALFGFEFADAVVCLHHFGRLYEESLSRGRLIVHDTLYLALHRGYYRYYQTAVAHRWRDILLYQTFALCRSQYAI